MDLINLGLPKAKLNQLNNSGLFTVEDVAEYFPRKYMDYSRTLKISEAKDGDTCRIIGTVKTVNWNPAAKMLKITIKDNTGIMDLLWFHTEYPSKILKKDTQAVFAGTVKVNFWGKQIVSPLFSLNLKSFNDLLPIYKKIKGMSDDYLKNTIEKSLDAIPKYEYLDEKTFKDFNLIRSYAAIRALHQPPSKDVLEKAQNRMAFDTLFKFAYTMADNADKYSNDSKIKISSANNVKPFLEKLPFALTDGEQSQLSCVRNIYKKWLKGKVSNALVQGDVGCGKTMVAVLCSIIMAENGYSTVIMAPTNILATQHYNEFKNLFKDNDDINPVLLVSGLKVKEKREILENIKTGKSNVIIGTHAVLSDKVEFNNLGLLIVDEEHRFGVEQRDKLIQNTTIVPHSITMSATPIPRSLALTIYGDNTDIYAIKKMPNGRQPVKTKIINDINNAYKKIEEEIIKGHQAYIVCPLIEESDSDLMKGVVSVNERYEEAKNFFKKYNVGMINGKMKQKEVDEEILKFKNKEYDILISTTIVEVGVNVPNSTVIMISNAERFGLATLHQLRGRVGRSSFESFCLLQSEQTNNERLLTMQSTTDGFIIAKRDLELRGMGDFIGTAQSGENQAVSLMILNEELYMKIRERIKEIRKNIKEKERYSSLFNL